MLSRRIRKFRSKAGLTQVELASRAKLTQGYLSALETGRAVSPSYKVIERLADALGVSAKEFFDDDSVDSRVAS